jgi:glycosyltransferase involved in cell wall biosynthesis
MARGFRSTAMQAAIDHLLSAERFDVVLVEHSQMALFDFPAGPAVVVHEHNIEYELLLRTSRVERSPIRKLFNWLESAKFRPDEIRVWKRSDGLVMMSERECRIVDGLVPSKPTTVMPCGVDLESLRPDTHAVEPGTVIFTGTMDYRPNADAAVYFAREILPRIVREVKDVRFLVVGRNPPDEVTRLAGPNLTLTANVPDVRPYLARAAVVVVPMRMGAGARLKVTEALAMGKAIVSTTLGCEGHPVEPGKHALIADDPAAFAAAVVRVLRDPALGAALGGRARALAVESYGWPVLLQRLEAFLIRIARAHADPARSPVARLGLAGAGEGGVGGR